MTKILFLPNTSLDAHTGAAVHCKQVIEGFRALSGWRVDVLGLELPAGVGSRERRGIWNKMKVWEVGRKKAYDVADRISDDRPDVCYLRYDYSHLSIYNLLDDLGIPYIVEVNSDVDGELRGHKNYLALAWNRLVEKRILSNSAGVLSVSQDALDRIERQHKLSTRMALTFNGADVNVIRPGTEEIRASIRERLRVSREAFLWCFVGNLSAPHGLDLFLRAISQVPELRYDHLLFVGVGLERYEPLLQTFGIAERVHRVGWVPENELGNWLCASDMGIGPLALYRKHMSMAQSLKEGTYLAGGLPVLTGTHKDARIPSSAPVFRLRFTEHSVPIDELVAARSMAILSREVLRQAAREVAEQHLSWTSVVESTEAFINGCLRAERRGAST